MSDAPELKPCPFCGGQANLCEGPKPGWWGTMCDDCGVWRDDRYGIQDEAAAAWNARADLAPLAALAMRERAERIADSLFYPDETKISVKIRDAIRAIPPTFTEAEILAAALRVPEIAALVENAMLAAVALREFGATSSAKILLATLAELEPKK